MSTYHSMDEKDSSTKKRKRTNITYRKTSELCEYMMAHPDVTLQDIGRKFGLGDSTIYNWFARGGTKITRTLAKWLGTSDNSQRLRNARPDLAIFNLSSLSGYAEQAHIPETPSKQESTATQEAPSASLSILREEALTVATQAKALSIDVESLIAAIDLVQQWTGDREKLDQANELVVSLRNKVEWLESRNQQTVAQLVRAQSTHSN